MVILIVRARDLDLRVEVSIRGVVAAVYTDVEALVRVS